jgi:hypothetical protein
MDPMKANNPGVFANSKVIQSANSKLIHHKYPEIGWDKQSFHCRGVKSFDFLRFFSLKNNGF